MTMAAASLPETSKKRSKSHSSGGEEDAKNGSEYLTADYALVSDMIWLKFLTDSLATQSKVQLGESA